MQKEKNTLSMLQIGIIMNLTFKMKYSSLRIIFNFLCLFSNVWSKSIQDAENLYTHLLNSSTKHIKPRFDQSDKVDVDILFSINSIKDYEEVYGILSFTGSFVIYWKDDIKTWNPSDYGGIRAIDLPLTETWTPTLLLRNGVDQISVFHYSDELDMMKATVTYSYDGRAKVMCHGLYQVTCKSDITYYPIDDHKCRVIVTTAYLLHDVKLSSKYGIYRKSFMPNAEWFITDDNTTKSEINIYISEDIQTRQDQIEFTIIIHREHIFPFVNVVLPILILSFVHLLIFLLPVKSGERISFSFTLCLTLVVFLTMVSEKLPPSASISVFNFFMLHQLVSSAFTTFLTVLTIRIFYKDQTDKVEGIIYGPIFWLYYFTSKCCRTDTTKITDRSDPNIWRILSMFFDKICGVVLGICFIVQLLIYGIVIVYRKTFFNDN